MFDLGWDEMALIAVVALVLLGPKELPNALRTVSGLIKNARRLAGEFQSGVNQIIREAELEDAKKAIASLNKDTITDAIEKHLDADGEIKSAFRKPADDSVNPAAIDEFPPSIMATTSPAAESSIPLVEGDLTATPIETGDIAKVHGPDDQHEPLSRTAADSAKSNKFDVGANTNEKEKSKIS